MSVAQPKWLVLRVPYYRGWRASIGGTPVPLVRAGGFFVALRAPAGRHDVVVRYGEPGLLAGGLGALAVLVLLPLVLRRLASPATPPASASEVSTA